MLLSYKHRFSNLPPCHVVCVKVIGRGDTQESIQIATLITVVPTSPDFRVWIQSKPASLVLVG